MESGKIENKNRPPLPIGEKEASNRYSYSSNSSHTMAGRTPLVNDVVIRIPFLFTAVKYLLEKNFAGGARVELAVLTGTKYPDALQSI